jgi:hypothetical protein
MKPCANHRETLMLDIYGELGPEARPVWEEHLKTCEACRRERLRMQGLVGNLKSALATPNLSDRQVSEGVQAVRMKLMDARKTPWWRKVLNVRPAMLVPAAVAFCALFLAITMVDMEPLMNSVGIRTASHPDIMEQMKSEDLEVIKNLDLLREMESLGKLVNVVDDKNGDLRFRNMDPEDIQGNLLYEKKESYA